MEASEPLVSHDDHGAKSKSTSAVKEKKRKLKAIFRKRALGNLSFRNATLNSTMFKASLKINNRALAQALERKKGELRAAEAINLQFREENQALMSDVSQAKLVTERTKQDIHARLRAVSCTMQLAVGQLVDAIDACTSGDFRKLSNAVARAGSCGIVPAFAAISEVERLPSLPPADATEYHTKAPSRVLASSSDTKDVNQNYGDDDLDVDEEDEGQDAAGVFDTFQNAQPAIAACLPASNLSLIVEQSYFIPNEAEFSILDSDIEFRRLNSQDRRNQVVFQRSSLDSPLVAESSKPQHVALRKSPSRSQHMAVQIQADGTSSGVENNDVIIQRSRSQDRRNAMIFRPSTACDDEDASERKGCATLRRSRSRSMRYASRDRSSMRSTNTDDGSRLNDSLHLFADNTEKTPAQDDTFVVDETVAMTSDLAEQVSIYKGLVKNGEIDKDQYSLQFVDETIICDGSAAPSATKESIRLSGSGSTEPEETVFGGQFVTRDKIPRTPVKASISNDEEECRNLADDLPQRHGVTILSDSSGLNLNESERDRSLTKRDIPTFVSIVSSPRVSLSPAKRKSGEKAEARRRTRSNVTESSTSKAAGNFGDGKPVGRHRSGQSDAPGKKAAENVRPGRRGTFVVPDKVRAEMDYDIMKEDDSVLIVNSFEDTPAAESSSLPAKDLPLPGAPFDGRPVDSRGAREENRSNNAMEKNVTVLMSEDMEQTQMILTTIVIPSADEVRQHFANIVQTMNSENRECAAGDSVATAIGSCSEFGVSGNTTGSRQAALDVGSKPRAMDVDDEIVDQLSHTVKRRKVNNVANLKLPATCEAAKQKSKDSGVNAGNLRVPVNPLKIIQLRSSNESSVDPPKPTRSKSSVTAKPEEAAKENIGRLLSTYDVSQNDLNSIPKQKGEVVKRGRSKSRSRAAREFSKDDSFVVDLPKKSSRRKRHETDSKTTYEESDDHRTELPESPRSVLLAVERKRKPSVQSKTDESEQRKENICSSNSGLPSGDNDRALKIPDSEKFGKADVENFVPTVCKPPDRVPVAKLTELESKAGQKVVRSELVEKNRDGDSQIFKTSEHPARGWFRNSEANITASSGVSSSISSGVSSRVSSGVSSTNGGELPSGGEAKNPFVNNKKDARAEDDGAKTVKPKTTDKKIVQRKEDDRSVESAVSKSQTSKLQPEWAIGSEIFCEESKIERRPRKRRAAQDNIQPPVEDMAKDQPERASGSKPTSSRNRKTLPDLLASGKALNPNRLAKNTRERTPMGNQKARKSTERSAKTTIPAPKNRSSLKTSELPTSDKDAISLALDKQGTSSAKVDLPNSSHQGDSGRASVKPASRESSVASTEGPVKAEEASERKSKNEKPKKQNTILGRISIVSNTASPRQEPPDKRSRRAAAAINYKEPTMKKKLRQGDPYTSTIYDGSSHN